MLKFSMFWQHSGRGQVSGTGIGCHRCFIMSYVCCLLEGGGWLRMEDGEWYTGHHEDNSQPSVDCWWLDVREDLLNNAQLAPWLAPSPGSTLAPVFPSLSTLNTLNTENNEWPGLRSGGINFPNSLLFEMFNCNSLVRREETNFTLYLTWPMSECPERRSDQRSLQTADHSNARYNTTTTTTTTCRPAPTHTSHTLSLPNIEILKFWNIKLSWLL